jgi:alpha-glucosidase (family GH31 glycosyl hydrolase)
MVLEFPDEPAAWAFDLQYCLGRELLVSPVVQEGGRVTTYLPAGRWADWWTGAIHAGPATLRRAVPLDELPLYLRDDALVVLGPERAHVGERPADPLAVEAFVATEATFALRGEPGAIDLRVRRDGRRTTFTASDAPVTFELRARDVPAPGAVLADGRPLARLDPGALAAAVEGWALDAGVVVARARAREIRLD